MLVETAGESPQDGKSQTETSADTSKAYTYYAVFLLMLVYSINIIDRNILSILLEPIKRDLGVSDTRIGFLTGFSFAIFYSTMAIPIAMWADIGNRKNIIALALSLFSVATVFCGLATGFLYLLLARVAVAVGEAGTAPASHSIIADMIPSHKRGTALGLYSVGGNIGILIGLPLAGFVSQWYGWRSAFYLVGAPGILVALLVFFTLREPQRKKNLALSAASPAPSIPSMLDVLKHFWSFRTLRHLVCGIAIMTISTNAIAVWHPAFLIRTYHLSPGEAATGFALIIGLVGGLGTVMGGYLADRMGKLDTRWKIWVMTCAQAVALPFCIVTYFVDSPAISLMLFLAPAFVFTFYMAPSISLIHEMVPERMRSRASAVFLLIVTVVGGSLGPQLTGILSDVLGSAYQGNSLRYAMIIMMVFWMVSMIQLSWASRYIRADFAKMNAVTAS